MQPEFLEFLQSLYPNLYNKIIEEYNRFLDYKQTPIEIGELLYYYREQWSEFGAIPYRVFEIKKYKNGWYCNLEKIDNQNNKISVSMNDACLCLYRTNPIK